MRARNLALMLCLAVGCDRGDPPPASSATAEAAEASSSASGAADSPPPAPSGAASSATSAEGPSAEAQEPPAAIAEADARRIDAAVRGAIDRGEVPGAVVLVVAGDRVVFHRAYGLRAKEPAELPMTPTTVFDLASLTKPIAAATSIALLAERGRLRFSDPASRHVPELASKGKGAITIEQLLLHTSGLPAENGLSEYTGDRAAMIARALDVAPKTAPGEVFTYSDVGYIVLGEVIARASSTSLDAFVEAHLTGPLGMRDTLFSPSPRLATRAAPTERLGDLVLLGRVHDPRARALGGVAGHAGLFSTALDLSRFARMLLGGGALSGARVLAPETVRDLLSAREIPGGKRAYLGAAIGPAVSHTGFTGTSLWIDPQRGIAVIILSNRVHPDGKGSADRLRRETIEACVSAAMNAKRAASAVRTGIDVLEQGAFAELRGRRVALLTHAAGRTRDGRSTLDLLRAAKDVRVVSLLSPEHGLASTEDGAVADARDPRTGLPIHSLYGASRRPTKAMLADADTIVIDLQDAGARFYTYATTVGYILEAAPSLGVRVVLLDRPNPTGGARIEGPVRDAGRESFVAYHPVPVRHGMTLGELSRMFVAERKLGVDLTVVPMKGYSREALFADTRLSWTPPSPNLKSPVAALLYPGVGLIELTNVSVGRGTDRPFERVGAPWIDGEELAAALRGAGLRGVSIAPVTFTPAASAFAGEVCRGVEITVTAPREVEAVRLGLALAVALRKLRSAAWRPSGLDTLLCHERAYSAIVAGEPLDRVTSTFAEETLAFAARRKPHLLY